MVFTMDQTQLRASLVPVGIQNPEFGFFWQSNFQNPKNLIHMFSSTQNPEFRIQILQICPHPHAPCMLLLLTMDVAAASSQWLACCFFHASMHAASSMQVNDQQLTKLQFTMSMLPSSMP